VAEIVVTKRYAFHLRARGRDNDDRGADDDDRGAHDDDGVDDDDDRGAHDNDFGADDNDERGADDDDVGVHDLDHLTTGPTFHGRQHDQRPLTCRPSAYGSGGGLASR
jgi:hypothetical protein